MKEDRVVRVFSKKLGREIDVKLFPSDLPKELYECVGVSNTSYGCATPIDLPIRRINDKYADTQRYVAEVI